MRIGVATLILCLAAGAPALAADGASTPSMNLTDAVSFALDHSSTVAAKVAAFTTAEHAAAQARGVAFPQVNASLQSYLSKSANYEGAYGVIGQSQQNVYSQNTAQIGITNYGLDTGGLSFLQLTAARAQQEQAREDLANTENQIATNVANGFYGIVQKQAIVFVDKVALNYQNVLVDVSKAKEHAGVAAGVDVLQAQSAQAKSSSQLVGDQAAVVDASESLAQQIGAPLQTHFALPIDIPEPPLPKGSVDALVAISEANRPDIASTREAVTAARATRKGWDRELFPQVQISALLGNQFSPTNAVFEQEELAAEGINTTVPRGSPGFWSLQAVTTFSLPLVDYGQRHMERVNDDAQLSSATSTYEQTLLQAELDVRQSYRSAQTAQAQLIFARQEAGYGTEAARIAQLQYKAGVKTIYDVLQAQQNAQQAQDDLVNARVTYVEAVVKLRVSLGTYDARSAVADLR
jgi:outer membrane protein TolC